MNDNVDSGLGWKACIQLFGINLFSFSFSTKYYQQPFVFIGPVEFVFGYGSPMYEGYLGQIYVRNFSGGTITSMDVPTPKKLWSNINKWLKLKFN